VKMKKFINAPETITDEELVGLGLANPDTLYVDGHLVVSRDLADADRVTVVTYGGSGHEPAQAGFVGRGMLDVQAVGDIFAAPNPQLVLDAIELADKGHGVLLLTLNYAGDQLAGKQALKLAAKRGPSMCARSSPVKRSSLRLTARTTAAALPAPWRCITLPPPPPGRAGAWTRLPPWRSATPTTWPPSP
jgi:hypothetical protein